MRFGSVINNVNVYQELRGGRRQKSKERREEYSPLTAASARKEKLWLLLTNIASEG